MGSVSSASSILSNVLQNLSAESPQLSTILSTSSVQAALAKASPGDIAELSNEALQLQQVGVLFGSSEGTQSSGLPSTSDSLFPALSSGGSDAASNLMMEALENSTGSNGTAATTAADSASNSQSQELAALFGTPSPVEPLINALG